MIQGNVEKELGLSTRIHDARSLRNPLSPPLIPPSETPYDIEIEYKIDTSQTHEEEPLNPLLKPQKEDLIDEKIGSTSSTKILHNDFLRSSIRSPNTDTKAYMLLPPAFHGGVPKPAKSVYEWFADDECARNIHENPQMNSCETDKDSQHGTPADTPLNVVQIGKKLGERWNALSNCQRSMYQDRTNQEIERYRAEKFKFLANRPVTLAEEMGFSSRFTGLPRSLQIAKGNHFANAQIDGFMIDRKHKFNNLRPLFCIGTFMLPAVIAD